MRLRRLKNNRPREGGACFVSCASGPDYGVMLTTRLFAPFAPPVIEVVPGAVMAVVKLVTLVPVKVVAWSSTIVPEYT